MLTSAVTNHGFQARLAMVQPPINPIGVVSLSSGRFDGGIAVRGQSRVEVDSRGRLLKGLVGKETR